MKTNSLLATIVGVLLLTFGSAAYAQKKTDILVTGKRITPVGTTFDVGSMPINTILLPDGRYALVGDMGFRQYLWAIDTRTGKGVSHIFFDNKTSRDGLYYGLAIASKPTADGKWRIYATQGGADSIAVVTMDAKTGKLNRDSAATIPAARIEDTVKHTPGDTPCGVAIDDRGLLYVANNAPSVFVDAATRKIEQGTVSIYDPEAKQEISRFTFPKEMGILPNYPFAVAVTKAGDKLYVSSQRDSKVYILDTTDAHAPTMKGEIVTGSHPVALLFNKAQTLLYVANAHSDTISIIDTATDTVKETILLRPEQARGLAGATPVGLTLSPDEKTLYAALGDMNAVAVIDTITNRPTGYIPTGWYPTSLAVSPDGKRLLIANAKGTKTRNPNPGFNDYTERINQNFYHLNIIEGNVATVPLPDTKTLAKQTAQVLENNRITADIAKMPNPLAAIGRPAGKIKHVIYIVKENRTYDQVFGDMKEGNGDPSLCLFNESITPNQHALARRFVLLDNFYVCGEASGDGWPWSTRSFANEYVIKNLPYNYSGRSSESRYDFEGQNNGYLVGGHPAKDVDGKPLSVLFPNGAPAVTDISETPMGTIWDVVKRANLPYRNYGFFTSFGTQVSGFPVVPDNYPTHASVQPEGHDLAGITDYDFRRFDTEYADSDAPMVHGVTMPLPTFGKYKTTSRYAEWKREFDRMLAKDANGDAVPAFMTVRFMNDHTEGLSGGKLSPKAQVADNDYAVGQLVEAISKSPIWESTAIFIVEDDSQSGSDHVDGHRSPCLVISPWIKKNTRDSAFYNTDSVLKTMWLLLGCEPMSQYDALADPIRAFDTVPKNRATYAAILPAKAVIAERNPVKYALDKNSPAYKMAVLSESLNFATPDSADPSILNQLIWQSVKGYGTKMPAPKRNGLAVKIGTAKTKRDADD